MKKLLTASAFLLLSLVALSARRPPSAAPAAAQDEAQALEARVAKLETDLADERKRGEEARAQLDQVLTYLDKQAKAAQALLGVLDEAEQQGFAVGENWRARQTLLAGWRTYWGSAETGLPKAAPPAAAAKAQPPAPRTRKAPPQDKPQDK